MNTLRGEPIRVPEPFIALRDELAQLRLSGLTPVLGSIQRAGSLPGIDDPDDFLPPGSKKICFGLDGAAFDDSGEHPHPFLPSPPAEAACHSRRCRPLSVIDAATPRGYPSLGLPSLR